MKILLKNNIGGMRVVDGQVNIACIITKSNLFRVILIFTEIGDIEILFGFKTE